MPMDFAFAGIIRATESINRCGRNNIYEFINKLDHPAIGVNYDMGNSAMFEFNPKMVAPFFLG